MGYYFMTKMCDGAIDFSIQKNMKEEVVNLPTEGNNHYTNGDQFSDKDGMPYIGYYHVHEDMDGNMIYMTGAEHVPDTSISSEEDLEISESYPDEEGTHKEIFALANKISIPFGDISEYGSVTSTGKDFVLQKYISIDGVRYPPMEAVNIIKQNNPDANISDIYPGTLEYVYFEPRDEKIYDNPAAGLTKEMPLNLGEPDSPGTRVVGLKGELGVRLGISLSLAAGGEITSVEVDALDVKISQMGTLEGNSKLLYCLVKNLREDEKFRLLTEYIFPLNKATAM